VQDRPSRAELLIGLRAPAAEPAGDDDREARFRARVAAGVEATLEREAAAGEEPVRAEGERLAAILRTEGPATKDAAREAQGEPDVVDGERVRGLQRELAAALRAGELDDRLGEIAATLRVGLAERLAVSRPGWTEIADDGRG
jgi:hypothetical protein